LCVATRRITSFATHSEDGTRELGERIGRLLERGDTVLLRGDLGAGKTRLAQGIARGLGVSQPVTSPSYVLMNEYEGRIRMFHVDLYRIAGTDELEDLGLWDHTENGCLVVEWPERGLDLLPGDRLEVSIREGATPGERLFELEAHGPRGETLLGAAAPN
jgi:tRNA threonylcarbamoyladenosine biosynthesis protein TsaE